MRSRIHPLAGGGVTYVNFRRITATSLFLLIAICMLATPLAYSAATVASQYADAARDYKATEKNKDNWSREKWDAVIFRFETIASTQPKSDIAPKALYMDGKVYFELARRSARADDYARSRRSYSKLTTN